MIKLAFCTDGIFPHAVGGMQRHSGLLIKELTKFDIEITVFHPHKNTVLFQEYENITEIVIDEINNNKNYLIECYKYSKRIYQHLKSLPEHIVYSQGLSVWHGIGKLKNTTIINPHGLEPYQALGFKAKLMAVPFKIIFNHIFRKANYVISLGGLLTEILKKYVSPDKIIVLPNGTHLPKHSSIGKNTTNKIKLFFISRFASNKGIDLLLEVADELNNEGYTGIEYKLAGRGPLFEPLKKKHKADNIHFLGYVTDNQLSELYTESDIFVLPTLFEGMPTVVLEAMAHKLPIIVSNVGATAEQVDPDNGYLITRNNKEELKTAIKNFLNKTPEEKKAMQQNSLQKVREKFLWGVIAQKYYQFFMNIHRKT